MVAYFISEIKKQAAEDKCVFVRVRPQLETDDFSKNLFKKLGFVTAPIHLHAELTSQLDITKPEESFLSNMRKATRYEVKKDITQGIKISTSKTRKTIKKFYNIQLQTSERQKFVPFSYKFLYQQFKVFAAAGNALLYSAELDGKIIGPGLYNFL